MCAGAVRGGGQVTDANTKFESDLRNLQNKNAALERDLDTAEDRLADIDGKYKKVSANDETPSNALVGAEDRRSLAPPYSLPSIASIASRPTPSSSCPIPPSRPCPPCPCPSLLVLARPRHSHPSPVLAIPTPRPSSPVLALTCLSKPSSSLHHRQRRASTSSRPRSSRSTTSSLSPRTRWTPSRRSATSCATSSSRPSASWTTCKPQQTQRSCAYDAFVRCSGSGRVALSFTLFIRMPYKNTMGAGRRGEGGSRSLRDCAMRTTFRGS